MSFTRLCLQCSVSRKPNAFVVTRFVSGGPLLLRRAEGKRGGGARGGGRGGGGKEDKEERGRGKTQKRSGGKKLFETSCQWNLTADQGIVLPLSQSS